jgi:hypothetical protein
MFTSEASKLKISEGNQIFSSGARIKKSAEGRKEETEEQ